MKYGKGGSSLRRGMTRRQFLRAGAIGAGGLYGLSALGCNQSGTQQPATAVTQDKQPKRGGTLNVIQVFDPQSMDPHTSTAASLRAISDFFYGSPLRFKANPTAYELDGDLVEKWETPDELTYILHVRKGVKWQNIAPVNGREVTAEDIVYNIRRIATPGAAYQRNWMFEDMAKIEVADKYTAKMTTKAPSVPIINYLADRQTKVVAKEVAEVKDALENTYIGTGPFIAKTFTHNVSVTMVRNPDYYVTGFPYLDALNTPIVVDPAAVLAALRSREADWAAISFNDMETLKRSPGDLQFGSIPDTNATFLRLRMNQAPFNDVRVRKALELGVDRKKLNDAISDGKGYVTGPIAPFLKDWVLPEAEIAKYLRYAPEESKKLLAEAGYPNGFKFTIKVSNRSGVNWANAAIILKDQYKAIGVDVEVRPMEHSAWVATQVARDFEAITGSTQVEGPDPDFIYKILHSKGPRQFSNYNNPKMDELLAKQRTLFNKEERKKVLYDIQRLALEDIPEVHLTVPDTFIAWQPHLRGYQQGIGEYGLGFRRCYEYWINK